MLLILDSLKFFCVTITKKYHKRKLKPFFFNFLCPQSKNNSKCMVYERTNRISGALNLQTHTHTHDHVLSRISFSFFRWKTKLLGLFLRHNIFSKNNRFQFYSHQTFNNLRTFSFLMYITQV